MEKFPSLGNIQWVIKLPFIIEDFVLQELMNNWTHSSFIIQGCIVGSEIIVLNGSVTTMKGYGCKIQRETHARFAVI